MGASTRWARPTYQHKLPTKDAPPQATVARDNNNNNKQLSEPRGSGPQAVSLDDDVRGGQQHGHSGDDGEHREDDEAEPVHDHGSELPVVDELHLLVVLLHSIGDELQLAQDGLCGTQGQGAPAQKQKQYLFACVLLPTDSPRIDCKPRGRCGLIIYVFQLIKAHCW